MRKDVDAPIQIRAGFSILSATCSELVTYPLDLAKTRLQIQGEQNITYGKKQGLFAICREVVTKEGFSKLYFGMSPAIYRHVFYSSVRMTSYQHFRSKIGKSAPLWQTALLGMTCGGVGQLISNPFDVVKVQMQNEGKRILQGLEPRVKSHKFSEYCKAAYRAGGYRTFFLGAIPNAQRSALVNLGDLTAYDNAKNKLVEWGWLNDGYILYFASSAVAGFVSAVLGTPADVIKTRMMNQPLNESGGGLYYRGSVDCLRQSIKNEGWMSLYKGFVPCWLRMAPWSLTFWLAYETLCSTAGYKSI